MKIFKFWNFWLSKFLKIFKNCIFMKIHRNWNAFKCFHLCEFLKIRIHCKYKKDTVFYFVFVGAQQNFARPLARFPRARSPSCTLKSVQKFTFVWYLTWQVVRAGMRARPVRVQHHVLWKVSKIDICMISGMGRNARGNAHAPGARATSCTLETS